MKPDEAPFSLEVLLQATREAAAGLGVVLGGRAMTRLGRYAVLLREASARMNLTAILDDRGIAVRHYADSLSALPALLADLTAAGSDAKARPYRLLDVGTGAGFPGIPLRIALDGEDSPAGRPVEMLLLDSLAKRTGFLREVIADLGLTWIDVLHARAEDAAHGALRESFDFVVARAVAPLPVLLEYGLPFVRVGGLFVAMKGPDPSDETLSAARALQVLGGRMEGVDTFDLPGPEADAMARSLLRIRKASPCPAGWPRTAGKPEKAPIL